MKGYKGFDKDLKCRDKQYEIGKEYTEPEAELCERGLHFCEAPHHCFSYYEPGVGRYCEVEADNVADKTDNGDSKRVAKHIKIGAEIDASAICKMAAKGFFEWFKYDDKITKAKTSSDNNAGNRGAANAGNRGAANAGYRGAANAGDWGAANAGDCGAANAGNWGAANAGDRGAANAGDWGAAIVRSCGTASVGKNGVAICMGNESKAKGATGALLVLVNCDDDGNIINHATVKVDGETIKPDTFYWLKGGRVVEYEVEA
jgi:hypothetical protein